MNGFAGRHTAVATLWCVLLAVAATGPALVGDRSLGPESLLDSDPLYFLGEAPPRPMVSDYSRTMYDLPRDFAAANGFRSGRFDLWNPRVGLGTPLWAEGGAPFFPLKLPFYIAPSRRTYDITTALRLVVAGLGAYLLARRRGLALVPALAAASVFELSGAMMTLMQFGSGAPPCLLGWVLLGAEEIARRRRPVAAAGSGIALGITANSGHPMLAVVVFAAFGAAITGHAIAAWRAPRTALTIVAVACLAVALGVAIGAPAFLPLLELQNVGRLYKRGRSFAKATGVWVLFSRHLLSPALFAPFLVVATRARLGAVLPYSLSPTVGVLGLVLAVAGILRRGLTPALFAVLLLGIATTVAPLGLSWLRLLPLLRDVYPCYGWSLLALPLGQAAGRGVAALETPGERRTVLVALALVLAGASSLLLVRDYNDPGSLVPLPLRQVFLAALADRAGWFRLLLAPVVVATAALALVAGLPARVVRRRTALATGLCALELLALAPAAWHADSKVLASAPSPAVRFLQDRLAAGQYRMLGSQPFLGYPSAPSIFGLPDVRGIAALPVERYVRYLEAVSPSATWFFEQQPGVTRHPLLDLAAVRYVARPGRPEPPPRLDDDPAMQRVYRDENVAIYENAEALPRLRIVHAAVAVRDQDEAFARLVEAAAIGAHAVSAGLTDRIFVEPSAEGTAPPMGAEEGAVPDETVRMLPGSDPDRVELVASLASAGWVVLADKFYPGWTATTDGTPTPIHPADLLFRAVFVPPGTHRIVFRYKPRAFAAGVALAVLGFAASGVMLVFGRDVVRSRG